MKIIHSADWHLGQTLYGYDRLDDQAAALRHIGAIIEREQPDAVIAAGDIFDSSQPSAAAQRLLSETLAEWHRLSQATRMVITAGNHDSASRHEVFRTPWTLAGVEAIGIIPPAEDFGAVARKLIVRSDGKGWIIALPFAGRRLNAEPELVAKLQTDFPSGDTTGPDTRPKASRASISKTPEAEIKSGRSMITSF